MRPTDENQDGSTRPNLLSGGRRRLTDDDNILARLERDSAREALGHRSRTALIAAAGALVIVLLTVGAWFAYEHVNTTRVLPMTRMTVDLAPADATGVETGQARVLDGAGDKQPRPVTAPHVAPGSPATGLPPLVLVNSARPAAPAPPAGVPTHASARPGKIAEERIAPDTVADTDVALLSAIIIHDSAHAAEKAQLDAAAACARAGRPLPDANGCGSRTTPSGKK